ncbi:uncharacterized protein ASCRUDRAFT_19702, partial [Ascoidea rubescens DSM 1968]
EGHKLVHKLKYYDLAALSFCGTIGSGITIMVGLALFTGGPATLLLTFIFGVVTLYIVLSSLCEMATYIPLPDGFAGYASRYVEPAFGFAVGYTFLFKYLILGPSQMSAASSAIGYWVDRDTVNPAVWITIIMIADISTNYLAVNSYAIFIRFFALFKITVIVGLTLFSLVLTIGGNPEHKTIGFQFWNDPGAFAPYKTLEGSNGKAAAFFASFQPSIFALFGFELYGIALGETESPIRKNIYRAHNLIFWTIGPVYIFLVLFLGMILSYDDPNLYTSIVSFRSSAASSPFVVAIRNAGIPVLPHIINACILIFVFTSSNTELYVAIRALYGLAVNGMAPKVFSQTNKKGIPYNALGFCGMFYVLGYMNSTESSKKIYQYFVNVVTVFVLLNYAGILICHLRFVKAVKVQGIERKTEMYYTAFGSPYSSYFALSFIIILLFLKNYSVFLDYGLGSRFDYQTFISAYIGIPIFFILYFGYKYFFKSKIISFEEMDLYSYKDVIDAEEE